MKPQPGIVAYSLLPKRHKKCSPLVLWFQAATSITFAPVIAVVWYDDKLFQLRMGSQPSAPILDIELHRISVASTTLDVIVHVPPALRMSEVLWMFFPK